ncbi:hypothetical protein KKA02_02340 [Patescibacteria group bacterium]|nr:hypothetical protein [Patescibacteria group bacterium]
MGDEIKKGLPLSIHSELNSARVSPKRFTVLRRQFANDPKALGQIDRYDPASKDTGLFNQLIQASRVGDERLAIRIEKAINKLRSREEG